MDDDFDKKVGRSLRQLRRAREHTLQDIGNILGMTPQAIYNYEQGKNPIGIENLDKLATYFKVSINRFLPSAKKPQL